MVVYYHNMYKLLLIFLLGSIILFLVLGFKLGSQGSGSVGLVTDVEGSPKPFVFSSKKLDLKSIFEDDHSWTATLAADKKISLIATGDVIPARTVNYESVKRNSFTWAF